jgi:general secretion pathway protein K
LGARAEGRPPRSRSLRLGGHLSSNDSEEVSGDDHGWALVSVLWVVSILSMMAAASQLLTVTSYRAERHSIEHAEIDAALDAAVARAILGISDARMAQRWRVDGVQQTFQFSGKTIRVAVQDEFGRYDLNVVDGAKLRQILNDAGVGEALAETLSDRILDWRTRSDDKLVRLHGTTDAEYAAADLPWRPRHGSFQSVNELQMVLGMSPTTFARIRPALTVYTTKSEIDAQIATREALLALYGGDAGKADALMRMRDGPPSDEQGGDPDSHPGFLNPAMPLTGRAFEIRAELSASRARYLRDAVVELTGDPSRPFLVLSWQ